LSTGVLHKKTLFFQNTSISKHIGSSLWPLV
jgi:hypothetical protein